MIILPNTDTPEHPRGFYLRQALYITLALVAASVMIYVTFGHAIWNLGLVGAWVIVILACRKAALRVVDFVSRPANGAAFVAAADSEGRVGVFLAFVMVLVVIGMPLLAPILLVWNLIRAFEAKPGNDGGSF